MSGPNVGYATLSIVPVTKGFQRALQAQIAGPMGAAMSSVSKGTSTLDKLSGAGGAIVSVMGKAAKAVGGLGILTAGLALKGGFQRAMGIEDAQAALRGLGHDTQSIEKIMDSALASVKGTAFGLGDAATIASTAVAAGIKPGEELTRTLKLTANSAALARTGLDEMGSILNKVWTAGRVQTDDLNQLADRGIPIWTELAESYGVSAVELRKMVEQGKVDSETFADVLENTVGDAALSMGDTTRGAWQNMMAALSRAGESFLKGVWPLFKGGLSGLTDLLDTIAPKVEEFGAAFSDWLRDVLPGVKEFAADMVDRLAPAVEAVAGWVAETLMPALVRFGKWLIDNKPIMLWLASMIGVTLVAAINAYAVSAGVAAIKTALMLAPFVAIIAAVGALVAGIIWAYQNVDWFRNAVDAVGRFLKDTLWPILQDVGQWLAGAFVTAWDAVSTAAMWLWNNVLKPAWSWISGTGMPILQTLVSAYLTPLQVAFSAISDAAKWLWNNVLKPLGSWLKDTFESIVDRVADAWDGLKGAVDAIAGFGSAAFSGLVSAINAVLGPLRNLVSWATSAYNRLKDVLGLGGNAPGNFNILGKAAAEGKLPSSHTGGVVTGPRGAEALVILEAGETVFTRDQRHQLEAMLAGQAAGAPRRGGLTVNGDVNVGSREDLSALEFWARSGGAGL